MLLRPALMTWNDLKVTDHNRAPLSMTVDPIERKSRMANGRLRKYVVAKKRIWNCSWTNLPDSNETVFGIHTVDNGMAAADIENFHDTVLGPFSLKLFNGRGEMEEFTVMISDFTKAINARGNSDLWDVTVTLEEC